MSALASARETAFGGEIELRFPYSEALVDALKTEIPGRYRRWDADEKRWLILGAYAPAAIDLLLEHFPRAEDAGRCAACTRLYASLTPLAATRQEEPIAA